MSPLNSPLTTQSCLTKVGMISLGCAKNLIDAEIIFGSVLERGMQITSDPEEADVLVVNTCAFIDSAKEESIAAILEAHQQRAFGKQSDVTFIESYPALGERWLRSSAFVKNSGGSLGFRRVA